MKLMKTILMLAVSLVACAEEWPRFRGVNGTGVASSAKLPVEFGPSKNVAWKAAVPFGQSSPIVSGGRVFVTASEGESLITLAFDASNGKQIWRRELKRAHKNAIYKANDPASPTPASDGKSVFVFFPHFGLIAYTHAGKEKWRAPLGPFENFYGMSAGPIVSGGVVILLADQTSGSYLLALDKETGKQKWKTERREYRESWGIPIVHEDQLITVGTSRVESYHLSTGEPRWWMALPSFGSMGSPVVSGDSVIVTADGTDKPWIPSWDSVLAKYDKDKDGKLSIDEGKEDKEWGEHLAWVDTDHNKIVDAAEWDEASKLGMGEYGAVAIPLASKGRVESSAAKWRFKRNLPYIPSPLVYDGVFYMVKTGGIVTTLNPADGSLQKQGRSEKALGEYYASPVAGAGKIYLLSEEGKVSVLKAGAQWEVLAVNDLGEECRATPAISGDRIFIRTRGNLYAFAER